MQDRMALCFHRFSWVNHRLIAFLFLLCLLENIHSQTFGCTFWVQRSRSILGILGLEQWFRRQCWDGDDRDDLFVAVNSLLVWWLRTGFRWLAVELKETMTDISKHFFGKNRRGGWHEALQMYPGTPGEKLINLACLGNNGELFLKMEFWKSMSSVDPSSACKWIYGDEWFEKWKNHMKRVCITV